jgi:hypothetical protein
MASYFVASAGRSGAAVAVHDRDRCPPGCFPQGAVEYLGEFLEAGQALAVARIRFPQARHCRCCTAAAPATTTQQAALSSVRS